ncbi:hypothetical protein MPH_05132 [Macrophomina phaseolina MS6]|uniref:Uncharacterized protein n=1 Tax=Macrophomina phaseolina (strain MS6) TaxID=1126212 RepID=K2RSJ2_MACPH|nr:hypothetical protein MPH_05132 [Macrophomina phaseolina MS6]
MARLAACILLLSSCLLTVTAAPIPSSTGPHAPTQHGSVADARIAAREVSSSTRSAPQLSEKRFIRAVKGLLKREPEPKRFSLDDFTTIAAANEKYDGLRPEGAGFVGLKQRGTPGWSRIF